MGVEGRVGRKPFHPGGIIAVTSGDSHVSISPKKNICLVPWSLREGGERRVVGTKDDRRGCRASRGGVERGPALPLPSPRGAGSATGGRPRSPSHYPDKFKDVITQILFFLVVISINYRAEKEATI